VTGFVGFASWVTRAATLLVCAMRGDGRRVELSA
jgi:hypothetical protein